MKFFKYHKIYETFETKDNKQLKGKWFVTEKIHGSNISFYVNKDKIKVAKRNGFIEDPLTFYDYSKWLKENSRKLFDLHTEIRKINDIDNIIVYGELYGGFYPDKPSEWTNDMKDKRLKDKTVTKAVQEGIYYSPKIEFCIFDIVVVKNDKLEFLNFQQVLKLVNYVKLNTVPVLNIGNWKDICDFSLDFDTQVPKIHKLEQVPKGTNTAEGIVIRHDSPRVLIKRKNKLFSEIKSDFVKSDKESDNLVAYVTLNRYSSVISKLYKDTKDAITEELVNDVLESFYLDGGIIKNKESMTILRNKCRELVDENFIC